MIMILSVDLGRSGCFFNFALTSDLANVLDFLGLGKVWECVLLPQVLV